jgi:predicted component of type VI protein secretion system
VSREPQKTTRGEEHTLEHLPGEERVVDEGLQHGQQTVAVVAKHCHDALTSRHEYAVDARHLEEREKSEKTRG